MRRIVSLLLVAASMSAYCDAAKPAPSYRTYPVRTTRDANGIHASRQAGEQKNDEYGRLVTILEEDFSKFTAGSEDAPATEAIATGWSGNFLGDKTNTEGWGGYYVHEAGGSAYIEATGSLFSPDIDVLDAVDYRFYVSFRARLAAEASEGIPTVQMGYGKFVQCDPLTQEWQDYRVTFSGAFSGTYLTFKATSAWLIDDIIVEKVLSFIDPPSSVTFSGYTVSGFKAQWSEVENASGYLLSVYHYDGEGNVVPDITDMSVGGLYHEVSGLPEIDGFYYFTVKATDSEGHISMPSQEVCVESLVVPVVKDTENIGPDGFTAMWNAVDNAVLYDFWAYRESTAQTDGPVDLVNTDFNFVNATDIAQDELVSYEAFPGWIIYEPKMADGAIGMDGLASVFGNYYASMESPSYDLSHGDGSVEISITAKATKGTTLTVSLFTRKQDGQFSVYPESYIKIEDLSVEYETRTFTLTGGGEESVIFFETSDWGEAWLDDLRISQEVKAGDVVTTPVYETVTPDTQVEVHNVDLLSGDNYCFIVRAIGINHDSTDYIYSDFTERTYVKYDNSGICSDSVLPEGRAFVSEGGLLNICNPAGDDVMVYDISGRTVHTDFSGSQSITLPLGMKGLYIVKIGTEIIKVIR